MAESACEFTPGRFGRAVSTPGLRVQSLLPVAFASVIARRGKVAWLSPLGQMDRERGKPMRTDAIFRIYSMTKPIASVALMMLHERAAFALTDPVHKWIPEWEGLRVNRFGRYPLFTTEPCARRIPGGNG